MAILNFICVPKMEIACDKDKSVLQLIMNVHFASHKCHLIYMIITECCYCPVCSVDVCPVLFLLGGVVLCSNTAIQITS